MHGVWPYACWLTFRWRWLWPVVAVAFTWLCCRAGTSFRWWRCCFPPFPPPPHGFHSCCYCSDASHQMGTRFNCVYSPPPRQASRQQLVVEVVMNHLTTKDVRKGVIVEIDGDDRETARPQLLVLSHRVFTIFGDLPRLCCPRLRRCTARSCWL